jgi:ribose transport system ATP-binding protein
MSWIRSPSWSSVPPRLAHSALFGIIAGATRVSTGRMEWLGKPYSPASPHQAIYAGVGLIHQELRLLPHLSIPQNVFVGRWPKKNGRIDRAAMAANAQEWCNLLKKRLSIIATE